MTWAVVHHARILYRGSRQSCADAAAEKGLRPRIVTAAKDLDRGIARGPLLMPAALLPERYRRRAA